MDDGRGDGLGRSRFRVSAEPSAGGGEMEEGGGESKGDAARVEACAGILKAFTLRTKGDVQIYEAENQQFIQAGRTRGESPQQSPGVNYVAAVALDPKDCAGLEFVQNVQATRVIVFKDGSQLVMNTGQALDGNDPYPTTLVSTGKTNLKIVAMNDSPSQGTGSVFGYISTISISESYKLFLRFKSSGGQKIIGMATWGWLAESATTDKTDNNALLKKVSGEIIAPEGKAAEGQEQPVTTPRIQDQKFNVGGGANSQAAKSQHLFNKTKKHQEDAASSDEAQDETTAAPCMPKLNFLKAEKTGPITMREVDDGCELSFGVPGSPGMSFHSEVEVPCAGRLEYLQLVNARRQRRDTQDRDDCLKSDGFVLDSRDPMAGRWVTLPGTKTFDSEDSPGGLATGFVYRSADDRFQTWLLWQPENPANSPRFPLAMVEWNWKAQADKIDDTGVCALDW
ncbi:MAG TPA: hypothetical protein VGB98_18045, partial [Pyrinomonadaceae bacterium]